jgi:hypothetical protein
MGELALAMAALELAEKLWPRINDAIQRGEVTVEEQAALKARIDSLRARSDGQFRGAEWLVSLPAPTPKPTHAE